MFRFRTDVPFNASVPDLAHTVHVAAPNVQQYERASWRCSPRTTGVRLDRLRVNAGLRYDLDPTLRINDFYAARCRSGAGWSRDLRQRRPRHRHQQLCSLGLAAALDLRGTAPSILRGGWGDACDPQPAMVSGAADEPARSAAPC